MSDTPLARFAHQRLDAYHVAMELFRGVEEVAATLPQGHAELKDPGASRRRRDGPHPQRG